MYTYNLAGFSIFSKLSIFIGFASQLSWQRICLQCRRPGFNSRVRKIPWRREWLPTPVFLSGEFPLFRVDPVTFTLSGLQSLLKPGALLPQPAFAIDGTDILRNPGFDLDSLGQKHSTCDVVSSEQLTRRHRRPGVLYLQDRLHPLVSVAYTECHFPFVSNK